MRKTMCSDTAIIGEKFDLIISQKNDHNHPATSENILYRQKIMSTLKRKAIDDVFTKPNKIIRKVLKDQTTVNISHSDVRIFRKSMDIKCPNVVWILNTKQVKMPKRAAPSGCWKRGVGELLYYSDENNVHKWQF
ncbi:hypothetical protein QTP88_012682 [Uroleucon formosanum]